MKYSLEGLVVGVFFGMFISAGLIFIGDFYERLAGFILTIVIASVVWLITVIIKSWMKKNNLDDIEIKPSTMGFLLGFIGPLMALAYTYANKIEGILPLILYMLLTLLSLVGFLTGVYIENKRKRTPAKKLKKV